MPVIVEHKKTLFNPYVKDLKALSNIHSLFNLLYIQQYTIKTRLLASIVFLDTEIMFTGILKLRNCIVGYY